MKQIAFLVLSCDKYSDLWKPYAQLFNRYWPDCPFDKYFATNKKSFNEFGFESILMGDDKTWSQGLMNTLVQLKNNYDYVLITLEDLFILEKIDTTFIKSSIDEFVKIDGNYLRLYTKTESYKYYNDYFGKLKENIPYRHNCVYSVWKISTLLDIISPEENAWEFEKIRPERTATMDGFFGSNKNCFVISNTVVKGKWVRRELDRVKLQMPDLVINREVLSENDEIKLYKKERTALLFFKYVPSMIQMSLLKVFGKR